MKALTIKFLVLLSFATANAADVSSSCAQNAGDGAARVLAMVKVTPEKDSSDSQAERRGCCSHHSGVCGCSNGRAVCCDGTFSPTCGCN